MGSAVASPASGDGNEEVGLVGDKGLLQFRGEHNVAVALLDGGEGGEDAASYAKIYGSHVGAFFGAFEGESDAAEIGRGHSLGVCAESMLCRNRRCLRQAQGRLFDCVLRTPLRMTLSCLHR